eukprot:1756205-Amphidinium_carterae.1
MQVFVFALRHGMANEELFQAVAILTQKGAVEKSSCCHSFVRHDAVPQPLQRLRCWQDPSQ